MAQDTNDDQNDTPDVDVPAEQLLSRADAESTQLLARTSCCPS